MFHTRSRLRPSPCRLAGSLLAALVWIAGCGGRAQVPALSQVHVEQYGTAELSAPRAVVFRACVIAIQMSGFAIQVAEPETGILVTRPREEPDGAGGEQLRAYVVEVRDRPDRRVLVSITPALSRRGGPTGRIPLETWDLAAEQQAWGRLFGDLRLVLERQTGARD